MGRVPENSSVRRGTRHDWVVCHSNHHSLYQLHRLSRVCGPDHPRQSLCVFERDCLWIQQFPDGYYWECVGNGRSQIGLAILQRRVNPGRLHFLNIAYRSQYSRPSNCVSLHLWLKCGFNCLILLGLSLNLNLLRYSSECPQFSHAWTHSLHHGHLCDEHMALGNLWASCFNSWDLRVLKFEAHLYNPGCDYGGIGADLRLHSV